VVLLGAPDRRDLLVERIDLRRPSRLGDAQARHQNVPFAPSPNRLGPKSGVKERVFGGGAGRSTATSRTKRACASMMPAASTAQNAAPVPTEVQLSTVAVA